MRETGESEAREGAGRCVSHNLIDGGGKIKVVFNKEEENNVLSLQLHSQVQRPSRLSLHLSEQGGVTSVSASSFQEEEIVHSQDRKEQLLPTPPGASGRFHPNVPQ